MTRALEVIWKNQKPGTIMNGQHGSQLNGKSNVTIWNIDVSS
jgi:hypothetical protein